MYQKHNTAELRSLSHHINSDSSVGHSDSSVECSIKTESNDKCKWVSSTKS